MKNYNFLWFIVFLFSGCAHYFEKNSETRLEKNIVKTESICLRKGMSLAESSVMDAENYRFGNVYSLVHKKYHIANGCDQKGSDLQVVINDEEKEQWGDFWKITLGIIPGVYVKTWNVRIYGSEGQLLLDKQLNGKLIVSIFFAPFFFLHKDPDQIIFDELDKYLQAQLKNSNKPS